MSKECDLTITNRINKQTQNLLHLTSLALNLKSLCLWHLLQYHLATLTNWYNLHISVHTYCTLITYSQPCTKHNRCVQNDSVQRSKNSCLQCVIKKNLSYCATT